MKKRKSKIAAIIFVPVFLVLLALFFLSPYSTALLKSKSQFIKHRNNEMILYEPGSKEYADKISEFLPVSIKQVEMIHGQPFKETFKIFICNTQKSFNEYIANSSSLQYPIRGTALLGDILISPSAFDFIGMDTHKETLMHELSHLHFQQRLNFVERRKHPIWFSEGFADYVADSGGEGIEASEAINFILSGKHFIPEEEGEIFGSFSNALNGLSGPMFHKQARMFVAYIIESDALKFNEFLIKIQNGESFSETFKNEMGAGVQDKWEQFLSQLIFENEN